MGLRDRKKSRTRQDILAAARRLFLMRGFDGTRIRDIAEQLQISEPTVFNYFPSKQAIVEALAEEWVAANARAVATQAPGSAQARPVLAAARAGLARYLEGLSREREFLRLLLDHSSLGTLQPTRRAPRPGDSGLLRATRTQLEFSARGYRLAQQRGELRGDVDVAALAEMVNSIIGTCLRTWVDTEPPPDLVELVFRRVGLLMDGARVGPPLDVARAVVEVRGPGDRS